MYLVDAKIMKESALGNKDSIGTFGEIKRMKERKRKREIQPIKK